MTQTKDQISEILSKQQFNINGDLMTNYIEFIIKYKCQKSSLKVHINVSFEEYAKLIHNLHNQYKNMHEKLFFFNTNNQNELKKLFCKICENGNLTFKTINLNENMRLFLDEMKKNTNVNRR